MKETKRYKEFSIVEGKVNHGSLPEVISNMQKDGYHVLECYWISDEQVHLKMRKLFDQD